jgi:hypothetical protein
MLHIQAASSQALQNDNCTVVQYGEQAFSQIRRFVIVDVRRGFVYAWYSQHTQETNTPSANLANLVF